MPRASAGQFSPALVSCPCLMSGITITWISATAAVTHCTTFLHNVFSSTTAIIWCTYICMYSSTVGKSQANFASQSRGCSASSHCIEWHSSMLWTLIVYLWLFGNTVNLASQCLAIQSIEDASQSRSHLQWLHSVQCPIATFTAQFKI